MKKHFAKGVALVIEVCLFLFMVFINGHFFMGLMPSGYEFVGLLGLSAVDGGVIAWYLLFRRNDQGNSQRTMAIVMFAIDIIAAVGSMVAELTRMAAARGEVQAISQDARWVMLVAVGIAIGINMTAMFIYKLLDPHLAEEREESMFEDEIREIRNSERKQVAPEMAQKWAREENTAWIAKMQHKVNSRNAVIYSSLKHPEIVDGKSITMNSPQGLFERAANLFNQSNQKTKLPEAPLDIADDAAGVRVVQAAQALAAPAGPNAAQVFNAAVGAPAQVVQPAPPNEGKAEGAKGTTEEESEAFKVIENWARWRKAENEKLDKENNNSPKAAGR